MKSKIIIILVLVVAFSLLLTGCFPGKIREEITEDFGEKIKENVTDKIAEAVEDAKIDVDVDDDGITIESEDGKLEISGGDDAHWPEDAPDIIPEWNKPLVSSVITKDSLIVGSKDIKVDEYDDYIEQVEDAGFEKINEISAAGVYMIQYKLDEITLSVSYTEKSEDLTITAQWE